jgi:alcohol dehydrogenase
VKAVLYETFKGSLQIQEVDDPTPRKDGVIIQLKSSGLCLSDWHGWMGHDKDIKLPHVPGHELAGIVIETGKDIKNFNIGDRVTVPFVSGCGKCDECITGNHQICDNQFQPGFTHWGSFAEFVAIDYADINLVRLPNEIDFTTAASLGCRFATSFRGVVDQGKVTKGQWVAVHGCGGVGLSAIMIASALGANVIAVDIDIEKLEFAKTIGAIKTINATITDSIAKEILEITRGGVHVSIDALGNPDILLNSINSLKKQGRHIQIGIMPPESTLSKIPIDKIIGRELEIAGSHGMQSYRYDEMIGMILDKKLDPSKLIHSTIGLHDVIEELPKMNSTKTNGIKVITDF